MKIILTNRFKNEYLKPLLKYITKEDLVKHLKERNHAFIPLRLPFFKLKNKINNFSFRGIVVVRNYNVIMPLIMFAKKDKKY
jgi:hypothetical protein